MFPRTEDPEISRRLQLAEVLVFLFLILPSLSYSFLAARPGTPGFELTAIATILRDLALVSLIVYFARRNREPMTRLGWNWNDLPREVAIGALLFLPMFYGAAAIESGLTHLGFSTPKKILPALVPAKTSTDIALALLLVIVVAFAEETIFRGYLIVRLTSGTGSLLAAVVLSSVIFSFGHGYEGSAGVATVGFMGLVFALVYVWRQSLVAPMVMHFLQDFVVIVLGTLFRSK